MRYPVLLLVSAVLIVTGGCRKAPAGSSQEAIGAAYAHALGDGQYGQHLQPHVHPDLVARLKEAPMLGNRTPKRTQTLTGRELKPITAAEIAKLSSFFDFPVTPTHVLEFTVTETPDDKTTLTSRMPLHLQATDGGYYVVFGLLRSGPTAPRAAPAESYTFTEREGLWRHLWELQPPADTKAAHRLQVREVAADSVVATLLTEEQTQAAAKHGSPVRFRLWSQGAEAPHERRITGGSTVPYAYQAGAVAGSDQFAIPAVVLTDYTPARSPAFAEGRMLLATFAGEVDGQRREFAVEWVRE
jgi:hypothetical protein